MKEQSSKQALFTLKMIHLALGITPVFFGIVVLFLNMDGSPDVNTDFPYFIVYIPAIFFVLMFPLSGILFKNILKTSLENKRTLSQKLAAFQTSHIVRMSLFEMAGILAAVVSFLTGDLYNLIIVALVFVHFLLTVPSEASLRSELDLSHEEEDQLNT